MEPKKPRSKTILFTAVVVLILIGVAAYYVTAIMNSDNRPSNVETQSVITL